MHPGGKMRKIKANPMTVVDAHLEENMHNSDGCALTLYGSIIRWVAKRRITNV